MPVASTTVQNINWDAMAALKVSLSEVMTVFGKYLSVPLLALNDPLPSESKDVPVIVRFVPGFVRNTLPGLIQHFNSASKEGGHISILRIDLDM